MRERFHVRRALPDQIAFALELMDMHVARGDRPVPRLDHALRQRHPLICRLQLGVALDNDPFAIGDQRFGVADPLIQRCQLRVTLDNDPLAIRDQRLGLPHASIHRFELRVALGDNTLQ